MAYMRCDACRVRDIGLWPVRIGRRRFHLCGNCAEATQAVLDEVRVIYGPVVAPEMRSKVDGLLEQLRVSSTRPRGYVTSDTPLDDALGREIVAGVDFCADLHACGLYGDGHRPHVAAPGCDCACHKNAF